MKSSTRHQTASRTDAGILRVLTWNYHGLCAAKLLALSSLLHDNDFDVAVITEVELSNNDRPIIPGYETFLPKTVRSLRVRVAIFAKVSLESCPIKLSEAEDHPIVGIQIKDLTLVGLYHQFALTGTMMMGNSFEAGQLNKVIDILVELSLNANWMQQDASNRMHNGRHESGLDTSSRSGLLPPGSTKTVVDHHYR